MRQARLAERLLLVAGMLTLAGLPAPAGARPGDLDPDFGAAGIVHLPLGPGRNAAQARALALQPDGALVVAGFDLLGSADFVVARVRPDGTLDPSFSGDGILRTDVTGRGGAVDALAVQPDGKIVAAGNVIGEDGTRHFALARFCPNGGLDTGGCGAPAFGPEPGTGRPTGIARDFGPGEDAAKALLLLPDGRLLAGGYAANGHTWIRFALARYRPDGTLDTSFGGDGRVSANCSSSTMDIEADNVITALALRPDGGVLAVGIATPPRSGPRLVIMQFTADGRPDPALNEGRCFVPDQFEGLFGDRFGYTGVRGGGVAVVIHADGGFSVGGFDARGQFAVWRFRANGYGDSEFAVNPLNGAFGFRRIAFPVAVPRDAFAAARAFAMLQAPDGGLVLAGCAPCSLFGGSRFALARLHGDGTLDLGFGPSGGAVVTEIGSDASASALVRQPDDKLVAAGYATVDPAGESFALARYLDQPAFSRFSRFRLPGGLLAILLFGIHPTAASLEVVLELEKGGQQTMIPLDVLDSRPGAHELGLLAQLPAAVAAGKATLHVFVDKQAVTSLPLEVTKAGSADEHAKASEEAIRMVADLFRWQSIDRVELGAGREECRARVQSGRKALGEAASAEDRALRALFGGGADTGHAIASVRRLAAELSQELERALECQ